MPSQLQRVNSVLAAAAPSQLDEFRTKLRIGVHWNTEVTLADAGHPVAQAFCSAMPVAYSSSQEHAWGPFARLILDAAYEATFQAAVINAYDSGNRTVFLTLLGGGAFGNPTDWILGSLQRAVQMFSESNLDVRIVSRGAPNSELQPLLSDSPS